MAKMYNIKRVVIVSDFGIYGNFTTYRIDEDCEPGSEHGKVRVFAQKRHGPSHSHP
jgi:hypothetical protein